MIRKFFNKYLIKMEQDKEHTLRVCSEQCDQCLFSKNRIVSASRMKEILDGCKEDDDHFLCHKATVVGEKIICKGFYDSMTSKAIRYAKAFPGIIPTVFIPPNDIIKLYFKRKL